MNEDLLQVELDLEVLVNELEKIGRRLRDSDFREQIPDLIIAGTEKAEQLHIKFKTLKEASYEGSPKYWSVQDELLKTPEARYKNVGFLEGD